MKISNNNIISPLLQLQGDSERMARLDETPRSKPDKVSLSNEAQQMIKKDLEKIEALANQVAEGNYVVDLDALAEAMVRKEEF